MLLESLLYNIVGWSLFLANLKVLKRKKLFLQKQKGINFII